MPGGAGILREVCKIGEVPRPRGGGTNPFSLFFIGSTRSARLPELSVTRFARGEDLQIPSHKIRALRLRKLPSPDSRGQ